MQHWKQHKGVCTALKDTHDEWNEARSTDLPDGTTIDTKEGPCAICLEETITNPVVMPCGHAFCFACVGHYQQLSTSKSAGLCPYCRGEIPNVGIKAAKRTKSYWDRACASLEGSEEQKKYAKLALAEMDSVIKVLKPKNKEAHKNRMGMLFSKVSLISLTDQPEETIATTKELLLLNDRHPGILELEQVELTKCNQAAAYVALGKWEEAGKIYKKIYNKYLQSGGHISSYDALVLMGLAQTKYELGKYNEAIEIGNVAIKAFRQYHGVHKYVALAHKAKGDIDEAKKTMSRAVLYEEHWNKDNMQKNEELLQELNNM